MSNDYTFDEPTKFSLVTKIMSYIFKLLDPNIWYISMCKNELTKMINVSHLNAQLENFYIYLKLISILQVQHPYNYECFMEENFYNGERKQKRKVEDIAKKVLMLWKENFVIVIDNIST